MIKGTIFSILGAGAVGGFLVCDICQPASTALAARAVVAGAEAAPVAAPVDLETVTLGIEGMTCGGCAIAARRVLTRLDGVEKAEVSHAESRAVVTYDPVRVTPEQMIEALAERLGYSATVVTG